MDFEQFLEQDIITFLEGKVEKKEKTNIAREEDYGLYLTKDYVKELEQALANDNMSRAKALFDELKDIYNHYNQPVGKKKIYLILDEMYAHITHYVDETARKRTIQISLQKKADKEIAQPASIANRTVPAPQPTQKAPAIPLAPKIVPEPPPIKPSTPLPLPTITTPTPPPKPRQAIPAKPQRPIRHTLRPVHAEPRAPTPNGPEPKESSAQFARAYVEGLHCMFQNDLSGAITLFSHIVEKNPHNRAARIRLQQCKEALAHAE